MEHMASGAARHGTEIAIARRNCYCAPDFAGAAAEEGDRLVDAYELNMDARQDMHVDQEMRQRVSARLVAASTMLGLSGMALHQAIVQELAENPAFEAEEVNACSVCGTPLQGSICPTCLRGQKSEGLGAEDGWDERSDAIAGGMTDDDFDPMSLAADRETLSERLLRDLGALLPRADRAIAEQLVWNLDKRGYLDVSLEEVVETQGAEPGRVEAVLSALQSLEPVGVGARDLRECLMIQIDHLASQGISCRLVREIVADHLADLGGRRLDRIARALRARVEVVAEAAAFIRARLNPFPAQGHAGPEAIAEARATYVMPDVAIIANDGRFEVEVIEARRFEMRVASAYAELARTRAGLGAEEQAHIRQYSTRAKLFIQNIAQRRATMRKVTAAIAAAQAEFLRHGVLALKPLTRSQIAQEVELDESTVSRATNGKHVMLPNGQVVGFDTFFTPALAVHAVMRDILAAQGPAQTDGELGRALAARGIHIARRTVAKYRGQMGVLSSVLRPDVPPRAA
jgi:RNA polymerase sigma-54 factor